MKHLFTIVLALLLFSGFVFSQTGAPQAEFNPKLADKKWRALWITTPETSSFDYGVYHFRKEIDLDHKPQSFVVNVSGDNRYRLFVNGQPVSMGPARGDQLHWFFETIDIAPYLKSGKNVLAAQVWNMGAYTPGAQMTLKTGFILQGNTEAEEIANTNNSWKSYHNMAYTPSLDYRQDVGATDVVDGSKYPWGWQTLDYDDSAWKQAITITHGTVVNSSTGYQWAMLPRMIPQMEEKQERMLKIRRSEGLKVSDHVLNGKGLKIPANTEVSFLIDQTYLTNAFIELIVSGGRGSEITLTYSEAMVINKNDKANRNDIEGRRVFGFVDRFFPDGGKDRLFRTLWFRTYRYVQVNITTVDEPLEINDLYGMYTAYPFKENGSFECEDPLFSDIWEVGWRTARLCAHETYFDCPFYEQLQYVGDTRIQALISLYVDGDDRLMRQAIKHFDWSRSSQGLTQSRYPSRYPQFIPPFSLYWVNMVHDYWMHRDDEVFVKECLPGVKSILAFFEDHVDPQTGMLGAMPHWNFQDWVPIWKWKLEEPVGGVPPSSRTGGSALATLQLAYTLKDAIELLEQYGEDDLAKHYQTLYESLCENTMKHCWDAEKQLLWDDIDRTSYSQHSNIMGILSGAVPQVDQQRLFEKLDSEPEFLQATFYYRFYLFRALKQVGLSDRYSTMLSPWKGMLDMGLTTFAENPEPTRSDCHAWSASPLYDFLATICGVEPAEAGFKSVRVAPNFGHLKEIKGVVAHPKGNITVDLTKTNKGVNGRVILPDDLSGIFIWQGKQFDLTAGNNVINLD